MAVLRLFVMALTAAIGSCSMVAHTVKLPEVDNKLDLCDTCFQLDGVAINYLLNWILNAGVITGCGDLCSHIPKGPGRGACDLICVGVGLKAFIKALENADLDPIYFCERLNLCPEGKDDAAGTVDGCSVSPATGPATTVFDIDLLFTILNATGAGEIRIAVDGDRAGDPAVSQSFVNSGFEAGKYSTRVSLDTTEAPDPDGGDPTIFYPGTYNYTFIVCQGECGSKHPHSITLGETTGFFQITN